MEHAVCPIRCIDPMHMSVLNMSLKESFATDMCSMNVVPVHHAEGVIVCGVSFTSELSLSTALPWDVHPDKFVQLMHEGWLCKEDESFNDQIRRGVVAQRSCFL